MADPFKILSAGDAVKAGDGPFNTQWHNAVSDATRKSMREAVPSTAPVRPIEIARDNEIWIANVSETNVDQFTAVGLGQLAIPPDDAGDFRERLCFLSAPLAVGQPFGIVQDPIGPGELYVCKTASGPGGQPPRSGWIRLKGDSAAWSSATTYAIGQQVTYDGDTWIAKAASTNQAPASGSYWQISGAHRGIWDRDEAYSPSDVVLLPQLGRIHIAGVSRAYLNIRNAEHAYAGIEAGELVSQRAPGPLAILWRGGIGSNWAVVRFCCDETLTTPDVTGTGALDLGALVPAATCSYLYTPGGAPEFGAVTVAGTGTYTPPAFTGSGALALGAAESAGVSLAYDVPPSGRLNLGALTADGEGEVTTPPRGRSRLRLGAFEAAGTGAVTFPAFTGSGAMTLGAVFVEHAHAHINRVVAINGDTTASQQIAVGDAGSDLNIATTAAAYDNAKTYSKGWVVLSSGSTYRFINATPSAGHSPPNATYWEDVTGQGLTIVNVPDISIPSSITSINSSSVAAQNITVKTYPNSYGIPYLASSISGVAWSSAVTYLANAVVTVGSTPYRALSLNTNLDPTTNPGTWVDITSQALWVLNLPDAGWTDGLQTKSGFVTDTVQIFDGAKTWNADGTFVHNLAVGDDLTVSGKTNCTHVRTSTGDSAGRVYGTYSLDDADPAYELRCYQKNVDVLGTPYDLSCALVVQANGGFNFLRASNAANTAGPPRIRVQTAGGPDHVDEVFSGTFATGYTGTANGMEFTSGWYTGTGSDFIEINPGYYSAENKNGSTIDAGMACAVHSSGTGVIKASSTDNTKIAVGLMQATTADTVSGNVQTEGLFTLSDWTAVIGASSLAAKTTYFLDPSTPGKLTATVPTTTGQTVQIIGTAVSATTLDLDIGVPILL